MKKALIVGAMLCGASIACQQQPEPNTEIEALKGGTVVDVQSPRSNVYVGEEGIKIDTRRTSIDIGNQGIQVSD